MSDVLTKELPSGAKIVGEEAASNDVIPAGASRSIKHIKVVNIGFIIIAQFQR